MDINTAKTIAMRTHIMALKAGVRAAGHHWESGPGLGKSDGTHQLCQALAKELNEPVGLVVFMLATISSADVRGFMLPIKTAAGVDTVFSTPPWLPTRGNMIVYTPDGTMHPEGTWTGDIPRVGVLFLDEFSQAEDDVKKPAAELVLRGQVGSVALPIGWRVLAAGNRMSDRSGVMRELMFIVNRRCKITINPSLPSWLAYANALPPAVRPHYLTMSFAQKNPDIVFKDSVPEGSDPFCTPRALCLMDRDLMALRSDDDIAHNRMPLDAAARELAAGWIGAGSAAQFFTHLKYHDELPEISAIERDPDKAKLPPAKDAQMVCGYMLAHNINEANAGKLVRYIMRLHIEMQMLTIRAIFAQEERAAAVLADPAMTAWLAKNKDVIIASRS